MESKGEINENQKADYIIKSSATVNVNNIFKEMINAHGIENVLTVIYNDLVSKNNNDVDSIGIWVDYEGEVYENSIELATLNNMEKYSDEEIYPIFELFKLMSHAEIIED